MSDYRAILERDLGRVGPAPFEFEAVVRRRERKQRNRRIAAGAVALALAILVMGGWLAAVAFDRSIPADDRKTPEVTDLPTSPGDWTRVPFPGTELYSITAGGPGLVAVGYDGGFDGNAAIWTSRDGRTWDLVDQRFANGFSDVTTGGPGLVAVGVGGGEGAPVWTSADGQSWTQAASDPDFAGATLRAIVAGGPGLVAVGANHAGLQAWYSADGVTWHLASVPPPPSGVTFLDQPTHWIDVAASDGRLVAVGQLEIATGTNSARLEHVVWTSEDGVSWTQTDGSPIVSNQSEVWIVAGSDAFVVAGTYDLWSSVDGERWQHVPSRGDLRFTVLQEGFDIRMSGVAAGNGGFVATGREFQCLRGPIDEGRFLDGDAGTCRSPQAAVWTSPDGMTWTRVRPDPRFETLPLATRADPLLVTAWGSRFVVAGSGSQGVTLWISDPPEIGSG